MGGIAGLVNLRLRLAVLRERLPLGDRGPGSAAPGFGNIAGQDPGSGDGEFGHIQTPPLSTRLYVMKFSARLAA
jgi:hypothetical protein